jgi:regulator of replication initiation timing
VVVTEVRRVLNLLSTDTPVRQQTRKRLGRSSVVGGGEGKEGDGGINLDMDVGTFDVPSGSDAAEFGALNPAEEARVADRVRKLTALEAGESHETMESRPCGLGQLACRQQYAGHARLWPMPLADAHVRRAGLSLQRADCRQILAVRLIAALEADAPRQAAQLQQWEDAFLSLTDATGESDPDRLVSRFLADDVSNYAVFAATVAMNDEASTLQEQLVRVTAEISQALDDANAAKAAQADALRAQLREAEIAAHDAEERERSLVSEMGAVADKLVALFRLLK